MSDQPFTSNDAQVLRTFDAQRVVKAVADPVLALVGLVVLSPLLVLIAVAVWIDSPGPALFRQPRLGLNNVPFNIIKFRTMVHTAEPEEKTIQATFNDPRITRLGGFLRRTSLDELPQLLNVLKGEMSIVGPRPHAIDHNRYFGRRIRGYFNRHLVKPGITGWAQVHGLRGETRTLDMMEARVQHDIAYVNNWSLALDIDIMRRTVLLCLLGTNAR